MMARDWKDDEIRRLKAASGNAQRTDEDLAGDGDVGNGS